MTGLELCNLVWSTPTSQHSKTLGYSDVGIAKICRKHKIPRPPRGYWAKKEAGQTPRQIPLPDPSNNSVIELRMPNMSQPEAPVERTKVDRPAIIEAWGFTYKSCLVWMKPQLGNGNY